MKQEENDLLLKDICARLTYGVKINLHNTIFEIYFVEKQDLHNVYVGLKENDEQVSQQTNILNIKPYLRSMSSMTDEENKQRKELSILLWYNSNGERGFDGFGEISGEDVLKAVDWLNAHHFDYRGLIEKGLALEALEGMYNK